MPKPPPGEHDWRPDPELVHLYLARPDAPPLLKQPAPDQHWVIAELTHRHHLTGPEIADRTKMSLRWVRQLQADTATTIATYAQRNAERAG